MHNIKKYLTAYFVFYGVTSFINNLARNYVEHKAIEQMKEGGLTTNTKTPTAKAHNHRGYM